MDVLSLRPIPAAGLFLCLTRRCPLSCAHCATNSMMSSEEQDEENFIRFVRTITPSTKPEIVYLTGGEALLRPQLVRTLTEMFHELGTRVCLLSGMFFARHDHVPKPIDDAILSVDHFSASLDIFHEKEVSRMAVLRALRVFVDRGQHVSLQITGLNDHDPYLQEVVGDVRAYFSDQVPVLVTYVKPIGRGKKWLAAQLNSLSATPAISDQVEIDPSPCSMAAWPVVSFNGSIVACCNQDVVDGRDAPHLRFGHIASDDWSTVRERYLRSNMLRAIRVFGPEYTNSHYGSGKVSCDGYCSTCLKLSHDPEIPTRLQPVMDRPGIRFIEEQMAKMQVESFAAQYGVSSYSHLVELGYSTPGRQYA